jgi:hypothetical protein
MEDHKSTTEQFSRSSAAAPGSGRPPEERSLSAEIYSTNPSLIGGGAIVAAGWFGSRPTDNPSAVWPYAVVGFGYLLYAFALSTSASVGVDDRLELCGLIGAVSFAISAFLFWRSPHFRLAIVCLAGGTVVFAWAWIAAARIRRRRGNGP